MASDEPGTGAVASAAGTLLASILAFLKKKVFFHFIISQKAELFAVRRVVSDSEVGEVVSGSTSTRARSEGTPGRPSGRSCIENKCAVFNAVRSLSSAAWDGHGWSGREENWNAW